MFQTTDSHIADALVAAIAGGQVLRTTSRVVKPSQGRPVGELIVEHVNGGDPCTTHVIVKGYNRGDGAATFACMRMLWNAGFATSAELGMPEPFEYMPTQRLLLQSLAPGNPLYEYIDDPDAALDAVIRTGRWLAVLHDTRLDDLPTADLGKVRQQLARFEEGLLSASTAWGPRVSRCIEQLLARWPTESDVVVTHGDFQPKNIHVDESHVTVIDFDRCALAPPTRDLGHFLAQSMTMSYVRAGSFERIERWNQAFLDGYFETAPVRRTEGLELSITYSMMEILYYKLFVKPVRDASFVPAWMDECERQLEAAWG